MALGAFARSDPLVVFAAAGIVLFAAYGLLQSRGTEALQLTAATRGALIAEFEALTGRPARPEEIQRIERDYVAEELLFREAIAGGLHLTDPVVRRRLVEAMRLGITGVLPDPTDEELVNHYAENLDRYVSEPTLTFEHVYFAARPPDGQAILARLQRGEAVAGEPFSHGPRFPRYGESLLRGLFGQAFVVAAREAPQGRWSGPLESPHGWHFIRPTERQAGVLLPFDAVRAQVESDYLATLIERAVEQRVTELARDVEVRIDR